MSGPLLQFLIVLLVANILVAVTVFVYGGIRSRLRPRVAEPQPEPVKMSAMIEPGVWYPIFRDPDGAAYVVVPERQPSSPGSRS